MRSIMLSEFCHESLANAILMILYGSQGKAPTRSTVSGAWLGNINELTGQPSKTEEK